MQLTRTTRELEIVLLTVVSYMIVIIVGNFMVAFSSQHLRDWKVSCHTTYVIANLKPRLS